MAKGTEIAELAIEEAMEAARLWKESSTSWKMIATERSSYVEAATYRALKAEKRVAELEAMVDGYEKTFVAQEDEIRKLANGIAKRDETIEKYADQICRLANELHDAREAARA